MMTGAAGGVVETLDSQLFAEGAASGRPQQVRMSGFYGALRGNPGTDIGTAHRRAESE